MHRLLNTLIALSLALVTSIASAAFFVPDDFQDGTTQGWTQGGQSSNPPVNIADGGPMGTGDNYLFVTTSRAAGGPGSRLVTFNASTWMGDYTGVSSLEFDVANLSAADELNIRVGIGGTGGAFATTSAVSLPVASDWQHVSFPFDPSDFTAVDGGFFPMGFDIDATLSDVNQLRIMSSANILFQGDAIDGDMGLDNIVAVPAISCDFNGSRTCDVIDINLLLAEGPINVGVPVTPGVNDQFDLDANGTIDLADRDQWLADAAVFNQFSSPYKLGDASLDGFVDGNDFILWNSKKFTTTLNWDDGNFNGDGFVDGPDFILWNANKFTSSDNASVPEPTMSILIWLAALVTLNRRRMVSKTLSEPM